MVNRAFLKKVIKVFLFCVLMLTTAGCTQILQRIKGTPEAFTLDLKPDEYSMEIMRLNDVIKSHPRQSERIKARYHLSSLYLSYKNPKKDYKKALEQLNIYISLDSKAIKQNDVRNCLSLLREIERLDSENMELNQTIEKLQTLDFQVEQKRKSYR